VPREILNQGKVYFIIYIKIKKVEKGNMCTSSFENIKINAKIVHLNLFIFYFQSNALSLLTILY
jgi:hypothetical protein